MGLHGFTWVYIIIIITPVSRQGGPSAPLSSPLSPAASTSWWSSGPLRGSCQRCLARWWPWLPGNGWDLDTWMTIDDWWHWWHWWPWLTGQLEESPACDENHGFTEVFLRSRESPSLKEAWKLPKPADRRRMGSLKSNTFPLHSCPLV